MRRKASALAPSANEVKLRSELSRLRSELVRNKRLSGEDAGAAETLAEVHLQASELESESELEALSAQVVELTDAKQRLSRLYFNQLEENRKRARKLHQVLENISETNAEFDLDRLLDRIAETVSKSMGFHVVLLRLREPGTDRLVARRFPLVAQG